MDRYTSSRRTIQILLHMDDRQGTRSRAQTLRRTTEAHKPITCLHVCSGHKAKRMQRKAHPCILGSVHVHTAVLVLNFEEL